MLISVREQPHCCAAASGHLGPTALAELEREHFATWSEFRADGHTVKFPARDLVAVLSLGRSTPPAGLWRRALGAGRARHDAPEGGKSDGDAQAKLRTRIPAHEPRPLRADVPASAVHLTQRAFPARPSPKASQSQAGWL
jgi:hypothetical protein